MGKEEILATSDRAAKTSITKAFLAIRYMMEAVNTPLVHIKERKVGVGRPPAMHRDSLGAGALLGC